MTEQLNPEDEIEYLKKLLGVTRAQLQHTMSTNAELEVMLQRQSELIKSLRGYSADEGGVN